MSLIWYSLASFWATTELNCVWHGFAGEQYGDEEGVPLVGSSEGASHQDDL